MNFVNYKLKTFISVLFSYSVVLFDWKIVDEKGEGTLALLIHLQSIKQEFVPQKCNFNKSTQLTTIYIVTSLNNISSILNYIKL